MRNLLAGLLFVFCSVTFFTYAQGEIEDKATGARFPSEISFEAKDKTYNLEATGVATRKKLLIKVYSIAHYVEKGSKVGNDFDAIIDLDKAKQFTIKWNRGVDSGKIQSAYQEAMDKAFNDAEKAKVGKDIDKFLSFFQEDAQKGDVYEIRSIPGGTIEVVINGKNMGNIPNDKRFAQGVWSIWFGPKSVVDREKLVTLPN